jgi:3-oxoacyl-[acyl-carrier protein] reductase
VSAPALHPAPGTRVAVAGGCGGIGRAVVRALLDSGARVTVLDLAASAARHPVPEGAAFVACDAREEASVTAAFAGLGPLDAFVNLVGYTNERRLLENIQAAEWDELMGGNLRGAFLLNRAAIPLVRAGGESGRIVNFTSTFGVRVALPGYSAYAAAKAGIISMTQALAIECGPSIRVNAIAPGLTDTDFLRGGLSRPEKAVKIDPVAYGQTLPLKRAGRPEDLALAVLFLLGPGGDWITGQTLHVNGGLWP